MTAVGEVPASQVTWYEATAAATREPVRLTFDLDVDVCVIGGGLAGLTAARELARRGWSVAVLDADRLGGGASGRNCGFVLPGFGADLGRIVERVGQQQAREMWALADAGRAYVRESIRETVMAGVDPIHGWLSVAKFAEDHVRTAEADVLREQFGADVETWSPERVRASLRSPVYFNGVHYRSAFHIHPLNYVLGLAAAAETAGVRIFETTPALAIDPAGLRKRIATPAARVRAAHIVLAGNLGLGALAPRLATTLVPMTTFVAVTEPLARLHEVVSYGGAISDTERADNHYRIVGGNRLLWSGGIRTWTSDPTRFAQRLAADIRRVYPQLDDVRIARVWSGTFGRTVHRMPQIGLLAPGLWLASGFGGHGLNTTAMAGMLIARAIAEKDPTWRLFEPYELVWAGGVAGRAVVQIGYAAYRLRTRGRFVVARLRHRAPGMRRPEVKSPNATIGAADAVLSEPTTRDAAGVANEGAKWRRATVTPAEMAASADAGESSADGTVSTGVR
jgi:glycine/D-amino acid oxidase-like deaminating enzyme